MKIRQEDNLVFHTPVTSGRHREIGYCEDTDFSTIKLFCQDKQDVSLYIETPDKRLYEHKGNLYTNVLTLPFSREEDAVFIKRQGRYSVKTAISLMLKIREKMEDSFSHVFDEEFILIGRTIYQRYCKVKDLCITVCGNMMFGNWWNVSIERVHDGKKSIRFSRKNYDRIVKQETKYYYDNTREKHNDAGLHVEKVKKWGNKFKI